MKKQVTFLLTTIAAFILVAVLLSLQQRYDALPEQAKNELGEDGAGRRNFEFQMLRSPKSNDIPNGIYNREMAFAQELLRKQTASMQKTTNTWRWSPVGPNNISGRICDVKINVADTNMILAAAASGGIWKSTNRGATWYKTLTSSQIKNVYCLQQDTRDGYNALWYAGTGEFLYGAASGGGDALYRGNGIYRSQDYGETWTLLPNTISNTPQTTNAFDFIYDIETDPSNLTQNELYAATIRGVERSSDAGNSWTLVKGNQTCTDGITDVSVGSDGCVYTVGNANAFGNCSVHRSPDGLSWTNITPTNFPTAFNRAVIAVAPSDPNIMYIVIAGANTDPRVEGIQVWKYTYISGNGSGAGGYWENRSGGIPSKYRYKDYPQGLYSYIWTGSGCFLNIIVKPDDPNLLMICSANLWRSTDGFQDTLNARWLGGYDPVRFLHPEHFADTYAGCFNPLNPNVYYSCNDGGVTRTHDVLANYSFVNPVTWEPLRTGLINTQFFHIDIEEDGSDLIMGGFQDQGCKYANAPGLTDWYNLTTGDGGYVQGTAQSQNRLYYSTQWAIATRCTRSLTNFVGIKPQGLDHPVFINPMAFDPNDSRIMYFAGGTSATTTGLWRTTDAPNVSETTGWTYMSGTDVGVPAAQVSAIGISTVNSQNVVYYGTSQGQVRRIDNANSESPSINNISSGLPSGGYVSCIAVDPQNSSNVLLTFSNYEIQSIWYSTDAGSNWISAESNLGGDDGPSVRWASIFYVNSQKMVFIGTSIGLFSNPNILPSDGKPDDWVQQSSTGIGNTVVTCMDYRPADSKFVVGTMGLGAYRGAYTEVALPIELTSFSGFFRENRIILNWETRSEFNNALFVVERQNANKWEEIGKIQGYGNSSSPKQYSFSDRGYSLTASRQLAYRLKQVDFDGSFSYSKIITVNLVNLPTKFSLGQNYPNPFNPETTVEYSLPVESNVELQIYSADGRSLREIPLGRKTAGFHRAAINAAGWASGVYYYRITAGKYSQTKKMIVLK